MIDFDQEYAAKDLHSVSIKVVGVGGAGGNTINSIVESGNNSIECIALNTDAQALSVSKANVKIQLGAKSTRGMGTGANPELGRRAAEEDLSKVMDLLEGADIVFLTGGMGGGTGSGALPVIARAVKDQGILSIAVVTKPFLFEGSRRARVASEAVELLRKEVDTLLIIPNQKLLDITDKNISMINAFAMINNVLGQCVKGISQIITSPGHINVDFADVRAIMKDTGVAIMGSGVASGQDRAMNAAIQAISSPLLENMDIEGATGVLLNITGSSNLGLHEIGQAASIIYEQASPDANIILGSAIDESMGDNVSVTVIATGFERKIKECDYINRYQERNTGNLKDNFKESIKINIKEKELSFEEKNLQEKTAYLSQEENVFSKDLSKNEENVNMTSRDEYVHEISKKESLEKGDGKKESSSEGLVGLDDFSDVSDYDTPSFMRKSI